MVETLNTMEILLNPHKILSLKESPLEERSLDEFFSLRLKSLYEYEDSPSERDFKELVFKELGVIIEKWLQDIAKSLQKPFSGQFFLFGSFKMQVNHKDSDLDTVCIVPSFISRDEHFFGGLLTILKGFDKVREIYAVDAMVPLIKLKFSNIPIDILFARLEMPILPLEEDFFNNDTGLLKNIDEKSYKSLNGLRTADLIMKGVSNPIQYRLLLKLIKLWAKNQLLYSSIMGYLGGISWAILAAKICQLYPNYCITQLLERFFFIYSLWLWDEMPVYIETMRNTPETVLNPKLLQFQWDEKTEKTEMNIITPAFPSMNSSHTVSLITSEILRRAFRKGYKTIRFILNKQKEWDCLFEKLPFFDKYPLFLEISILAAQNEGDFLVWKGHYESRLRKLLRFFENLRLQKLVTFRLNPIGYDRKDSEYAFCVSYYIGIKIREDQANHAKLLRMKELDLDSVVRSFLDTAVESHLQMIPDHLNTRVRLVSKEEIDIGLEKPKEVNKETKKKLFLNEKIQKLL